MSLIDPTLVELLVCPVDKADLVEDETDQRLECVSCGRRYPVREGIPVMLIDQAEGGPDE